MTFGKNRVQYDERFWQFMRWKNFDTYFYAGGQELAVYTGNIADKDLEQIEKIFDYQLDGKIDFIIYNKLSDAKQSNIGLETEEMQNNIGGLTRIVGNKVFLYFTGNHEQMHRQIREGIARVLIDQIMYGGDIKDRLQNAALLALPDWYINGLISYLGKSWDVNIDNRVRDGIVSKKYLKFNHLSGLNALYAGHSIWNYIITTYGESSISNLLYMTRINRNVESGFLFVLGISMQNLADNWKDFMLKKYEGADKNKNLPTQTQLVKRPKPFRIYTQVKAAPDGQHVLYVRNELGRYKVMLYDVNTSKTKRIAKGGFKSYSRETDESFPVVAWHPSGLLLSLIKEKKGKILMDTYTLETKKWASEPIFPFEKILDYSYSDDGQSIVVSAIQKGQSDIFVFNLRSRTVEQITKDFCDDLNPRFINHSKQIVFSSNRSNDTIDFEKKPNYHFGENGFDIFIYDYASKSKAMKRITNTRGLDEMQPMPFDLTDITFLSEENGIVNRYIAHVDSVISFIDTTEHYRYVIKTFPVTNYSRNIISQDVNFTHKKISESIYSNGNFHLYIQDAPSLKDLSLIPLKKTEFGDVMAEAVKNDSVQPANTTIQDTVQSEKINVFEQKKEIPTVKDSSKIDINDYVFQSDFPKSKNKKQDKKQEEQEKKTDTPVVNAVAKDSSGLEIPKIRNYEIAFASDYVVTQVDNTLLNYTYQSFTGVPDFFNPGLNGFIKLGISDLMEDYKITGGFKFAGDFNSTEYFLSYENLKKRLDKQLVFYRQGRFMQNGNSVLRVHTHALTYGNKWPFSDVSAIKGAVTYRNDRQVLLSTELQSLQAPNIYKNWASGHFEFVYDNTISTGLNLYNGMRFKIFAEYFKQVDRKNSNLAVLGIDFRHYQKIHREIIWANRFAASTSFGKEKLIYYMGALDNWITPQFDRDIPVDYSQNYVYQATATNIRGFKQNIRNGNTFALINSEIRVPLFRYIFNRPIKSDFIRNFQVVGFGDVGTAWTGNSPYDSTNSLNNKTIQNGSFTITIISQHEPIVGGYGFGLRSRLLGYFVRTDWAWGVQDGVRLPYIFYVSLSLDF